LVSTPRGSCARRESILAQISQSSGFLEAGHRAEANHQDCTVPDVHDSAITAHEEVRSGAADLASCFANAETELTVLPVRVPPAHQLLQ
jgi:hypothetical protein